MRNANRSPVPSRPSKLKQTRKANSKTKQKRRADTHARALTLFSENGWSRDPSAHLTASACLRPAGRQTSTLHPAALAYRLGRQRRRIRRRRRLGSKASLPVFFTKPPCQLPHFIVSRPAPPLGRQLRSSRAAACAFPPPTARLPTLLPRRPDLGAASRPRRQGTRDVPATCRRAARC